MQLRNLTPHPIAIYRMDFKDQVMILLPPVSPAFRLEEKELMVSKDWFSESDLREAVGWGPVEQELYQLAFPIVRREYVAATLPEPQKGVGYVVSLPALMGLKAAGIDRRDVFAPDTGPGKWGAVRDEKGNVAGCYRLVTLSEFPEGIYGGEGWPAKEWEAANEKPIYDAKEA